MINLEELKSREKLAPYIYNHYIGRTYTYRIHDDGKIILNHLGDRWELDPKDFVMFSVPTNFRTLKSDRVVTNFSLNVDIDNINIPKCLMGTIGSYGAVPSSFGKVRLVKIDKLGRTFYVDSANRWLDIETGATAEASLWYRNFLFKDK